MIAEDRSRRIKSHAFSRDCNRQKTFTFLLIRENPEEDAAKHTPYVRFRYN